MTAKTTHFRVDNGDMMLIEFESGRRVLVDVNIRTAADDADDETPDVAKQLRARLTRDSQGRPYVDAFLLSHPDADHCRGLKKHFHLGKLSDWSKSADKIVIREMWSSPIVFRRASKNHTLCDDAKAWNTEARRRVARYREIWTSEDGDRIKILGEDVDGKTDDLGAILVRLDTDFSQVTGITDSTFAARLLGPLPAGDDEEEDLLTKNDSSTILNVTMKIGGQVGANYLIGGDAEVAIWERVWKRNSVRKSVLEYDVLIAPHHCSWHSLSWDSWSKKGEDGKVSEDARKALGQAKSGACVLASSKPVVDDENDPPCIRAKREYKAILNAVKGKFYCIADGSGDAPYELEVTAGGVKPLAKAAAAAVAAPYVSGVGATPLSHG
ncbi:metallohydrolase [Rhodoblastus sp.]|jgi:hypothetical protein|uniref:metallohydrolase n=1 Tax=Rhodoblastus sp. TaxID=1962975 RepID=UPI0025EF1DA1|nr:metallohydrolase [Rhodoblastus sp.]